MHSNFITPPDYVETILIINATQAVVDELSQVVKTSDHPYNVYFYNDAMNDMRWLARVSNIADEIIDADKNDPLEFFNK